jgi:hypothetical protein
MASLMRFVSGTVDDDRLSRFVAEMEANPRRNNAGKWHGQLSTNDIARIEAAARGPMVESGYEPTAPPRPLLWPERAYWRLHHRLVQLQRVAAGRLRPDGGAHLEVIPEGSRERVRVPARGVRR